MAENTNKKSLSGAFSTRSVRAGGYSVLVTAIALAAVIFVNLIVSSLPAKYTKLDATKAGLYTLDAQTLEIISDVSEDITVYHVCQAGKEDNLVTSLLERYASYSSHIKTKKIDPVVSPAFVAQYTEEALGDNSLIVESAKRSKVVPYTDIVYTDYSNITEEEYYYYINYGVAPAGETVFAGENALTSAVDFVTVADIPQLYTLTGHGEAELSETMRGYISDENFGLEQTSLLTGSEEGLDDGFDGGEALEGAAKVPEDADGIMLNAPTSDISEAELEALLAYVREGGSVIVVADYKVMDLPNLTALAKALGLEISGSLVIEGSQGYYTQRAYWLLPEAEEHAITDPVISDGKYVLFANTHGMTVAEALPEDVTSVTPLFKTSENAISKQDTKFESIAYAEGDNKGQFVTAAAVELGEGKAVWFASPYITDDSADSMVSGGNSDTILNSFGWTCGKSSSITVRTIKLTVEPLVISSSASNAWLVAVAVLVPLASLGGGLGIWLKRRSR